MIPRIIHQMWIGPPMPPLYKQYVASWRHHHSGWEHWWWTGPPDGMANQGLWDRAHEISPAAPEQFRSDVARYEILAQHGGVWVDADFLCQKPIDEFLDCDGFAVQHDRRWVANGLIGVMPGHPAMVEAVVRMPGNVEAKAGQSNTRLTGPQFFTPIANRHSMTILPERLFLPYSWNQLDQGDREYPEAYAVHHWHNQRRKRGLL